MSNLPNDVTAILFEGTGPFTLPPIHQLTVSMTESHQALIQGLLPDVGDGMQRFVHIPLSLESAMLLLALLSAFRNAYDLPLPDGPISDTKLQ